MRKVVTEHSRADRSWRRALAVTAALLVVAACSGAPQPRSAAGGPADAEPAAASASLEIQSLELVPAATGMRIEMATSGPLVWTTYRDGDDNLVVELPNSRPGGTVADLEPAGGLVSAVRVEQQGNGIRPLTRVVVSTRAASEHEVMADGAQLRVELMPVDPEWSAGEQAVAVAMPVAAEPAATPEPSYETDTSYEEPAYEPAVEEQAIEPAVEEQAIAPAAASVEEAPPGEPLPPASQVLTVEAHDGGDRLLIVGDGEFYHSSFSLENPDRFVIDLVGVVNAAPVGSVPVGGELVERVRVAQFKSAPQLVARVVVDLTRPATPQVVSGASGLMLAFAGAAATTLAEDVVAAAPAEALTTGYPEPASEEEAGGYPELAAEPAMGGDEGLAASDELEAPADYPDSAPGYEAPGYEAAYEEPVEEKPAEEEPVYEEAAYEEPAYEEPAWQEPAQEEVAEAPAYEPYPEPATEEVTAPPAMAAPAAPPAAPGQGFEMFEVGSRSAAAPAPAGAPLGFGSRSLDATTEKVYYGDPMTITLKDADIKDVLRSFAQISGLNVVVQPGVSGTVTVELTNVPWDQALEQVLKINNLGYQLEGNIMRIAPIAKLREEAEEQQRLLQAQALSIPLSTVMKRVSYAEAGQIAGLLRSGGGASLMSQRGSVVVDARTNTLIIKELPSFIDKIITVIETLDTPEPQVMIEARIIETTKRFSSTLGISWGFDGIADAAHGNTTGLVFPNNVATSGGVNLATGGANGFLDISLGNVLNTFTLDAALQAAESDGLINILSAPRITTLNNQLASIQSGLQIPIQTVANNTVSVQFVNATLRLDVTPHVTAEGTVLMDINIQKREPQLAFAVQGASNAPISTKDARTRVIVRDGGTTVIGGIYKVTSDRGEDRVPGLANVPILKHLFKNKRRSEENEELLIFITPRVVKL